MVLRNLSFQNEQILSPIKLVEESIIRQIIYVHLSIQVARWSPDVKNKSNTIDEDFVVTLIDETTGNTALA